MKKVVIITGASSGIGRATALELAKKCKIILSARRESELILLQEEIIKSGGEAFFKVTDVSNKLQVQDLINFAIQKFGSIDVLINNAGIMPLSSLAELKVSEWEKMIDVNIKGVLYSISAVLPIMRKQNNGHIISLSSIAGHLVKPNMSVYSATKYAVRIIMEGLRQEEAIANSNIRLTTISPGAVSTELLNTITNSELKKGFEDFYSGAIKPEDIAKIVDFAIEQPDNVTLNEIIVRPTKQEP
jgi:NADP-dependent 3-hydroxy acid dehydrogenase YdfG